MTRQNYSNVIDFLNTAQSDTAAGSVGISLESFFSSLIFSITYCLLQIIIFIYLKDRFENFYDPFGKIKDGSVDNRFSWLLKILSLEIESFRSYGLEAYLFLRYLFLLLFMFLIMTCFTIPILIPVNYFCGASELERNSISDTENHSAQYDIIFSAGNTKGLDMISTANISPRHTDKYILHFTITIIIVTLFHIIMKGEIKFCIKEKNRTIIELISKDKLKDYCCTLYVQNIPTNIFPTTGSLKRFFNQDKNIVDNVWNIYEYKDLERMISKFHALRNKLESLEVEYLRYENGFSSKIRKIIFTNKPLVLNLNPKLMITIPALSERVDSFEYLCDEIKKILKEIDTAQREPLEREDRECDDLLLGNTAFVHFKTPIQAAFMHQIILRENIEEMKCKIICLNPKDIIWDNILKRDDSVSSQAREIIIFLAYFAVTLSWVLPVAMVGSISQLPYLTALIPTVRWINKFPKFIKGFIAGILPSILLVFLTGLALQIFRLLTNHRRILTGSSLQTHLQQWMFLFLHFHLFIVITISSGFIVVLENLVYRPTTVPSMVAKDIPKASNFFFSFFIYRGLNLLGNGLLQFYRFITEVIIYPKVKDSTPRSMNEREKGYQRFNPNWGEIYPTFSVYGSIGLVYSVISPLVLLFCCINFLLDLITYRYLLAHVFNKNDKSDTYGKLYPMAWRQLYAGIYSLEIFLMGLLFLVKDEEGNNTCFLLGILMIIVLGATIWAHVSINKKYTRSIEAVPYETMIGLMDAIAKKSSTELETNDRKKLRLEYLHPVFQFNAKNQRIWIPTDPVKAYKMECKKIRSMQLEPQVCGYQLNPKGKLEKNPN